MIRWRGSVCVCVKVCVCIWGRILTIRLQGRRPKKIGSELTGAPQRVSVLRNAEHSFPLQREVSDRPWMGKGGGENHNLRAVRFLAWMGRDGADEPSMDGAMIPTECRALWHLAWIGKGYEEGGYDSAFLLERPQFIHTAMFLPNTRIRQKQTKQDKCSERRPADFALGSDRKKVYSCVCPGEILIIQDTF